MPSKKTGWYHVETFSTKAPANEFVRIYKAQGNDARVVKTRDGYEVQLYVTRPYTRAGERGMRESNSDVVRISPRVEIRRVGQIEKWQPSKRSYRWVDGWAVVVDGKVNYPWLNKSEARREAKAVAAELSRNGLEERGTPANADNVRELVLYIDNDGDLYRQMTTPIMRNLARKMLKGTYDHDLAVKGWGHLANAGAQKYTKEFGGSGNGSYGSFSPADRKAAAVELADAFENEMKAQGQAGVEHLAGKKSAGENASDFSVSDKDGTVSFQGRVIAYLTRRGWTIVPGVGDPIQKATSTAIWRASNDISARDLLRKITDILEGDY